MADALAVRRADWPRGQGGDYALEERADDRCAAYLRVLLAELAGGDPFVDDLGEGCRQASAGIEAHLIDVRIHRLDDHRICEALTQQRPVDEGRDRVPDPVCDGALALV